MKTITFNIPKGGTGKTTSVSILSHYLANKGYKVLMLDLDPQGNLSLPYYENTDGMPSVYEMIKGENIKKCIYHISDNLHLIYSDLGLADATDEISDETIIKKCLNRVKSDYDVCIIDTPPTFNILNINALTCSDGLIIPITADKFALNGVMQLNTVLKNIHNKDLELYGILITRYDKTVATDVMIQQAQDVAEYIGTFIYDSKIRNGVAIRKAQDLDGNLFELFPRENVTKDYIAFCEEFEKRYLKGGK